MIENVPIALVLSRVYRAGRIATEIADGVAAEIPHQSAVIKFGFSSTIDAGEKEYWIIGNSDYLKNK